MTAPELLTRRRFLARLGAMAAGLCGLPAWAAAAASAAKGGSRKALVVLFQRGAADGLNMVAPFGDPLYVRSRPSIRVDAPTRGSSAIDLDGRFALHPALAPLGPLWDDGRFAVVHAVGSPEATRSHFDAQDYMETGTPGRKGTADGWLNRTLRSCGAAKSAVSGVAVSGRLPISLRGRHPTLALGSADDLERSRLADSFEAVYDEALDALLAGAAQELGAARRALRGVSPFDPSAFEALGYPKGRLGRQAHELARILRSGAGLRVGFLECGGWDHHFNEGAAEGQLARKLAELASTIAAFYRDLGDRAEDVLLVTLTEFGRTVEENGNRGTDHGHASAMLLFGSRVAGGRVHGRWPGLAPGDRFEGRDLQVTTDFRQVLSELVAVHLGATDLRPVFPGGPFAPIGVLKS